MVDEKRIEELSAKRHEVGLSDDEADELGRLFAEREGKPYSNARSGRTPAPSEAQKPAEPEEPGTERATGTAPQPTLAGPDPQAEHAGQPEEGAGPGKSTT